ncbi:MAG: GNAT family N-acetyltransferase [Anaerolineales bacterium]|nr:GNAT family N-acetyltransferase [Anaerolineales bacterium]
MQISIGTLTEADWEMVCSIYKDGIETGDATFEEAPPDWEEWNATHLSKCRIIARMEERVVGWAALSPVSSRCVYEGVAEVSIYVATPYWGMGVGKALLGTLIEASEEAGIWTLESSMFPENERSLRLHRSLGFREVGFRERIGQLDGKWRDTILMERRSKVIGTGSKDGAVSDM